jgi:thiamine-phosphate pyrophosphorylase
MPLDLRAPASYLVSPGATTPETTPAGEDFRRVLALVRAAVEARVDLIQLREKLLRPRVLYELAARSADITRATGTRLLVNDRADIASACGADGVHLAARSLEARVVRESFGSEFLIGISTHTLEEATAARDGGADLIVFGPVFDTPSKREFGSPAGLARLREVARAVAPLPVFAIGGITRENAPQVIRAGARGVAAIRLFGDADNLREVCEEIRAIPSVHD